MAGKGSKRRPGKPGAYERGYEAINWSKGRPAPAPRKPSVQEVLLKDYTTKGEWVVPSLEEILGPRSSWPLWPQPVTIPKRADGEAIA